MPADQVELSQERQQPGGGAAQRGIDDVRRLAVEVLEPGVGVPVEVDREPDRARWLVVLRCRTGDAQTAMPTSALEERATCSAMATTAGSDTTGPSGTSSSECFTSDE